MPYLSGSVYKMRGTIKRGQLLTVSKAGRTSSTDCLHLFIPQFKGTAAAFDVTRTTVGLTGPVG